MCKREGREREAGKSCGYDGVRRGARASGEEGGERGHRHNDFDRWLVDRALLYRSSSTLLKRTLFAYKNRLTGAAPNSSAAYSKVKSNPAFTAASYTLCLIPYTPHFKKISYPLHPHLKPETLKS